MEKDHNHSQKSNTRNAFICGAAATLLATGCGADLEKVNPEELANAKAVMQEGNEFFTPVIKEFAKSAQNDEYLYGFDGEIGAEAFSVALDTATASADMVLKNERLFKFNDPNYKNHALAFYKDIDVGKKLDLMAINYAYNTIVPLEHAHDWYCEDEACGTDHCYSLTWTTMAHEGAHEVEYHGDGVTELFESGGQEEVLKSFDVAFLITYVGQDMGTFFDLRVADPTRYLESWLQYALVMKEDDPSQFEKNIDNFNAMFNGLLTPEGWADYSISDSEFEFFNDYWAVPLEEQKRIIAESGWYEVFVEKEMQEFISEARRELGIEFRETELKDICSNPIQEWEQQRQREMDGYEHERQHGMKRV